MALLTRSDDPVLARTRATRAEDELAGWKPLLWFTLAYSPFLLNDLLFIQITDWRAALPIDYGTRFVVIGLLLTPRCLRAVTLRHEALAVAQPHALILAAACVGFWGLLHAGFDPLLRLAIGDTMLAHWVNLPPGIAQFDRFVGIGLVALSEELMSRRCAKHVLRLYLRHDGLVIAVSAVLFGAMHWSQGIDRIVSNSLIGAVFMATYLRVGALWPTVVAHYVIDVIATY